MIKKGIILAGGTGSRMSPLTKVVNKQLLPIHDKPLIYYPLSILMLAKIKDVLIVVNKNQLNQYKDLFDDGKRLGIRIKYVEQEKPKGLPDAFILGKDFIKKDNIALILGDNFFYGQSLTNTLLKCINLKKGCKIILHEVINPEKYGIAKIKDKKIISIIEKPKKKISNFAITGLYFFDNHVVRHSLNLKPSRRRELEISDLLNIYNQKKKISFEFLGRGGTWLDTGSIEDYHKTNNFVSTIENQQGFKIACLEEIALKNKWINKKGIKKNIKFYGKCEYSNYLFNLIKKK